MSDVTELLLLAIDRVLGGATTPLALRSRPWWSATFAGTLYRIVLLVPAAGQAAIATLAEADLPLPHHFVADLAVAAQEMEGECVRLALDVLAIEEAPPVREEVPGPVRCRRVPVPA